MLRQEFPASSPSGHRPIAFLGPHCYSANSATSALKLTPTGSRRARGGRARPHPRHSSDQPYHHHPPQPKHCTVDSRQWTDHLQPPPALHHQDSDLGSPRCCRRSTRILHRVTDTGGSWHLPRTASRAASRPQASATSIGTRALQALIDFRILSRCFP
ncbi:hypothetical protein A4X06_0g400 [Tilletia controversa]|uniref:Uncharacterized protein n=1 Tax=Tilletia controversa TaxID=13291 RepID=A0A8X7N1W0_9BASI|nr:hypothetical protein A4X06_0g400 [Tilletia controversa]